MREKQRENERKRKKEEGKLERDTRGTPRTRARSKIKAARE
jgi:hypothetical protein